MRCPFFSYICTQIVGGALKTHGATGRVAPALPLTNNKCVSALYDVQLHSTPVQLSGIFEHLAHAHARGRCRLRHLLDAP